MKGNFILSQPQDPAMFDRKNADVGFDYDLLVEELSYWTFVTRDQRASASLRDYAAGQVSQIKSRIAKPREFRSLKKLG